MIIKSLILVLAADLALASHEVVFKQIDRDADSNLSKEELSTYFKSYHKQQINAMLAAGSEQAMNAQKMLLGIDVDVKEIFRQGDKDNDGYMSLQEFAGPKDDEWSYDPAFTVKQ
jgi:Ca2+-binding EF-hand superfamily protein